jgi:YhgE/Pip-like protein
MLKQVFKFKLTWAALAVSLLMAMLMAFSYLGAFLDPADNTHNLPLALVNADQGVALAGQNLNYGQQVVARLTGPQASDAVKWTVLDSRDQALNELNQNKYYAALVIPANYSAALAGLASPTATAPAQLEILTNPAAGTYAGSLSQSAAQTAVTTISKAASAQLVQTLSASGAKVSPQLAALLADPVQAQVQVAVPVGGHSARGLSAFYFALMLTLSGFVGSNIIFVLLTILATRRANKGEKLSSRNIFYTRAVLNLVMAVLAGVAVTWVAAGWLGMDAPNIWTLTLFAILVVISTASMSLLFQTALGQFGLLAGIIFFTILGVPASGGPYPVQMLPGLWQGLHTFLPLGYATDGVRALLFMGGSQEAGLAAGWLVLALYTLGGLGVAWLVSFLKDRRQRRVQPRPTPAGLAA